MKGIVVTLEQFEKVPIRLRDRVIVMFSGANKFHLISIGNDEDIIGEIICSITGEKKIPMLCDDDEIKFCYPDWIDMA